MAPNDPSFGALQTTKNRAKSSAYVWFLASCFARKRPFSPVFCRNAGNGWRGACHVPRSFLLTFRSSKTWAATAAGGLFGGLAQVAFNQPRDGLGNAAQALLAAHPFEHIVLGVGYRDFVVRHLFVRRLAVEWLASSR